MQRLMNSYQITQLLRQKNSSWTRKAFINGLTDAVGFEKKSESKAIGINRIKKLSSSKKTMQEQEKEPGSRNQRTISKACQNINLDKIGR